MPTTLLMSTVPSALALDAGEQVVDVVALQHLAGEAPSARACGRLFTPAGAVRLRPG